MKSLLRIALALALVGAVTGCVSGSSDGDGDTATVTSAPPADPAETAGEALVGRYFRDVARELLLRRDSAMRTLLRLDDQESETFWSIKDEYDSRISDLFDEELALIARFTEVNQDLTREVAGQIARQALDLDRRRLELHEEYFGRIKDATSPVVAVQWLQLQTYFEHQAQVGFARGTPLAMP